MVLVRVLVLDAGAVVAKRDVFELGEGRAQRRLFALALGLDRLHRDARLHLRELRVVVLVKDAARLVVRAGDIEVRGAPVELLELRRERGHGRRVCRRSGRCCRARRLLREH